MTLYLTDRTEPRRSIAPRPRPGARIQTLPCRATTHRMPGYRHSQADAVLAAHGRVGSDPAVHGEVTDRPGCVDREARFIASVLAPVSTGSGLRLCLST